MTYPSNASTAGAALAVLAAAVVASTAAAQQVINEDLVVRGSQCVGARCDGAPKFGLDTIRLREEDLRIKFEDTSTSFLVPSSDWQITINDVGWGGLNKFAIDEVTDQDQPRTLFTLEAGAPEHSLYVESSGDVGLGTSTPARQLHIRDGVGPTVRLEQDGSAGITPQTWDITGYSSFFVANVTTGHAPFQILAGAPENALIVDDAGRVGLGTSSPSLALHVKHGDSPGVRLEQDGSDGGTPRTWDVQGGGTRFVIRDVTSGDIPLIIEADAPHEALFVQSTGNLGIGTSLPARELHITDGFNTAVRLERNDPQQTWDIVNQGSFSFIDITGNSVPFSIAAGAPSSSFAIASAGNVAVGPVPGFLRHRLAVADSAEVKGALPGLHITNTDGATNNKTVRFRKFNFGLGQRFSIDAVSDDLARVDTAYAFVRPDGANVSEHQFYTGGAQSLTIDGAGNVALRGSSFAAGAVGTLNLASGPTAPANSIGDGVILYAEDVGGSSELLVRDEAGNVTTLSPHNFEGFEPDPDDPFPWSYHSRNPFLGQEMWVDMSGAIRALEKLTGQTFIHRRDVERADWGKLKQAAADAVREQAVLDKMREEVEVAKADAIEAVAVTETVEGKQTETVYRFDPKTGEVVATERPVMVERPTGEKRMRIKAGVRLDEKTGKFFRNKTRKEAEAEVPAAAPQKMPKWIATRIAAQ